MRELVHMLSQLSREIDKQGWDLPPTLMTIEREDDTLTVESVPMGLDTPLGKWIDALAKTFVDDEEVSQGLVAKFPNLYGFILTYEAWGVTNVEALEKLGPHQGPADSPEGQEMRCLAAVTLDGEAVHTARMRDDPKFYAVPWDHQGGPELAALVSLGLVVAKHYRVPQPALDRLIWMQGVLTTLEEAEAAVQQ